MTWSKVKKGRRSASVKFFFTTNPEDILQLLVEHYGTHPTGRGQQELAGGLNSATMDYHSIRLRLGSTSQRERCSGRGEWRVNPKHPQAAANRRNAPKAKMVNQRLKDNSGQISEHQYSGRKLSNYSKAAKRKGEELQHLCWRRYEIDYL